MGHILVLGAGYGGLPLTQKLIEYGAAARGNSIELVDRNAYHTLVPRLHEAAAATLPLKEVVVPLSQVVNRHRVQTTRATVTGFDFAAQRVLTQSGALGYDVLAIALGSVTNFYNIPGLEQYSLTLKTYGDARDIRAHVEEMFQRAAQTKDNQLRRRLLTFVIGGGGFTGVQMAGELSDWADELAIRHRVARNEVHIIIVEMLPQIMHGFQADLVAEAMRVLSAKQIDIRTGTAVERMAYVQGEGKYIYLRNIPEPLATETMIWTGGVRAPDVLVNSGLQLGSAGRVVVNRFLQVPAQPNVFVLGDAAYSMDEQTQLPVPPSAQLALLQSETVARNIIAHLQGGTLQPFALSSKGIVVGLGRTQAVGMVGPVPVTGYTAALLKRATELRWLNIIGGPSFALNRTIGTPEKPAPPASLKRLQ